jgi:nitric oxide reductase NorD protein
LSKCPPLDIAKELNKLPHAVLDSFQIALELMASLLNDEEQTLWAKEGLAIGNQSSRSWEAAVEYYAMGPQVARSLSPLSLMQWARCGSNLAQDSPKLAIAFFRASPSIVSNLRPKYIPRWAALGRNLHKGTWKSNTLAVKFFEASPALVHHLPFWDLEIFASLIETVSSKSYDAALDCLAIGQSILPKLGREREAILSMALTLSKSSWRQVKICLDLAPRVSQQLNSAQAVRFLKLGEQLASVGINDTSAYLRDGIQAFNRVPQISHEYILDLAETLSAVSPKAVHPFLKSLGDVLNRINLSQFETWFQHGFELLKQNKPSGIAFFKVESTTSHELLDSLSSSLELERVKEIIRLYCGALSGTSTEVLNTKELVQKNIGWIAEEYASTDGSKVFLPTVADHYLNKFENFTWFKVIATHQVAHLEFGSFQFRFNTPATLFTDRRFALEKDRSVTTATDVNQISKTESSPQDSRITDIGRFLALFDHRRLAFDLFTVLEDVRLDYRITIEYPGINKASTKIRYESLALRPWVSGLPIQEALVELLVHMSLGKFTELPVLDKYREETASLARILGRLRNAEATVEDTIEATLRAYAIISLISNDATQTDSWGSENLDNLSDFSEEEFLTLIDRLNANPQAPNHGGGRDVYQSPKPVEYRGEFKPEIVQLLAKLQSDLDLSNDEQHLSREMLETLLQQSPELELEPENGAINNDVSMFAQNIMKEAGIPSTDSKPGQGYGPLLYDNDQGGALEARDPKTYVYNEWDFRTADYKPKWCIVKEKTLEEGDPAFYSNALNHYASLSASITHQFEMMMPETFRKTYRLVDGEDLDLNAALEAWTDIRMNVPPNDKIYWRRNKIERDVAVVFLLDMSASTAEAIDDEPIAADDPDAPNDPVDYMVWLHRRREGLIRRQYKRIIDLEKESTVLLIQALESIGDTYGIYGFSGYGRENVEFYVIKDIEEPFSERIKGRIDKIAPLHATRMGPAIRHATTKLEHQDAATKILFLISDGRPQDRGYSREGVEKEYAVHDSHMALIEARRKHITPFCLTVDKSGHDYLKTMCEDMSYEVLTDIWTLPQRLPLLYRRLTI